MSGKTGIFAVIPVKLLRDSKSRLSGILDSEQRQFLTLLMLEDVVAAIQLSRLTERILVVTPDEQVIRFAHGLGVESFESNYSDLNSDLECAIAWCIEKEAESVLVILADIPTLSEADLRNIVVPLLQYPNAVLSPSKDGGTNVLLLHPCGLIRPCFGVSSFKRHLGELKSVSAEVSVYKSDGTSLDIDTPEDIRELLRSSTSYHLKSLSYLRTLIS